MNGGPIFRGAGRNPFYLLSALFMLAGCFALTHQLTLVPGHWKSLLLLIGVLQVYELVLLAIAVYLERRGDAQFDATTLFLLGLLFVVDATHLNGELAVSNPSMAPWIATWLLLLAAGKLAILRSAVGLTSPRPFAVAIAQIAIVLYLPGIASGVQVLGLGPQVLPRLLYGLWWLVGCLPLVALWAGRRGLETPSPRSATTIGLATLALPLASLFVHLLALHWLYGLPLEPSYATPLLLGTGTFAAIAGGPKLQRFGFHLRWSVPGIAVAFSLNAPSLWVGPEGIGLVLSPFRLALLGAALVWLIHYAREGLRPFSWAAGGSFAAAISGHSPSTIVRNWERFAPTTAFELGVACIAAAFALLALGFARSLLSHRVPPERLASKRV